MQKNKNQTLGLMLIGFFIAVITICYVLNTTAEMLNLVEQSKEQVVSWPIEEDKTQKTEPAQPKDNKKETSDQALNIIKDEKMKEAIKGASEEFDVPVGLMVGIAYAESSLGNNFYKPGDENCYNWWGIKGGLTPKRIKEEGSYIRCFISEEAGARTVAKLLRNYYINYGLDTPEKIVRKYVGKYSTNWVKNVNKYYEI